MVRVTFALRLLSTLLVIPAVVGAQIDVWIDPGHGGEDPGNLGYSGNPDAYERVLTLEVSGVLGSRLGQIGYSSLKTRNGDNYPDLIQRAEMADGSEPNDLDEQEPGQMFVSVHMNSAPAAVFGTETYYPPYKIFSFDIGSYRVDSTFAATIHTNMMTGANLAFLGCNNDRHIKKAGHVVTTRARVPSVLVEVCFTTNQCQQTKIEQQGNQALIANGIAAGISNLIVPGGSLASASRSLGSAANATVMTRLDANDRPESPTPPVPRPPAQLVAGIAQSISEGFESPTFPPTGWSTQTAGQPPPYNWHRKVDPLYVYGGFAAARVGPQSASAIDEWLISPPVTLGGGDSGLRFFWNGNRNHAQSVNARCLIRPIGAGQWTEVWSLQTEPTGTEFRYQERVVDLTPWTGMQIEFAFRVSGTNGAEFVVDDISIGTYSPTSPASNDACGGAIPISGGTHTFSGTTCYAANDLDGAAMLGACGVDPLNASEVFFWLSAASGDTLSATVTGPWAPVLYLVNTCNQAVGSCLSSSPTLQDGDVSTAVFQYVFPNAGVYFLVLDGIAGQCGNYELTTQIRGEVTGVEARSESHRLKPSLASYPNPASRVVRFAGERSSVAESSGRLRVYTVAGRLVSEQVVLLSGNQFSVDWEATSTTGSRLPSGVYVATVKTASELVTTRFVLTH